MCFSWYLSWPQLSEKIVAVFISKCEQIFWRYVCHSIDVREQINKEGTIMKTQEEYAREIDEIVLRDVKTCQSDWFNIDRETFMLPENKNRPFVLGTRKTGCDLLILGGSNCNESNLDQVFGCLGNEKFYVCEPIALWKGNREIREVPSLYAFKAATSYFRNQAMVPVFEDLHCKLIPLYEPQYIQNLQEISSEAISRLTDTKDFSRDEAFEIIQDWAKEFTEKCNNKEFDNSLYYDSVDKFIENKLEEL